MAAHCKWQKILYLIKYIDKVPLIKYVPDAAAAACGIGPAEVGPLEISHIVNMNYTLLPIAPPVIDGTDEPTPNNDVSNDQLSCSYWSG